MFTPRIINKIKKANLIGRGCNSFATADKWELVRKAKTKDSKFVICNISESEPGVFKDKYILEMWQERVVEGIKLAMKTVGAKKGFIYINPEYYDHFFDHLIATIRSQEVDIEIYEKPLHDYIGGEETAVINSMEGKRVEPKLKPPYPTTEGFLNQPTLVNNCETFYAVSLINSDEYKNTRFYCCSLSTSATNHSYASADKLFVLQNKQVLELPTNITIRKALLEFGHNPSDKYFYQVGGGAGGNCYNHKQLNRKFSGLASIIIYNKNKSEKDIVLKWLDFFKNESCGQCVPCREGTFRLRNIMEEYFQDNSSLNKEVFEDLIYTLQNTSFCPLGRISANAMLSYFKNVKGRNLKVEFGEKCDIK
ncbi:MAG: NADH-ubiquinone oxidoreductase-F iron-sulfur binding region domain-containing protein [Patescibacteria group bacterium]